MKNYLYDLAVEILGISPGQSKVKFAKLIYFVHKELVRSSLVETSELSFIRMPLGPVPVGFMDLENQAGIKTSLVPTPLMYNTHVYDYIGANRSKFSESMEQVISSTLKSLDRMSTTDIVDLSHKEASWTKFENGKKFMIDGEDLKTILPKSVKSKTENDINLQEKLVDGMMSDIVDSSTSLEYPEDEL